MELLDIVSFLKMIPVYIWVIFAIIIVIIFGQRKVWEFEAKFFSNGIGRGEVEIECTSSKFNKTENLTIEVDLSLEPDWRNKVYEVFLNGSNILNISAEESYKSMNRIRRKYRGEKPEQNDLVEIKCEQEVVFSSKLYRD